MILLSYQATYKMTMNTFILILLVFAIYTNLFLNKKTEKMKPSLILLIAAVAFPSSQLIG